MYFSYLDTIILLQPMQQVRTLHWLTTNVMLRYWNWCKQPKLRWKTCGFFQLSNALSDYKSLDKHLILEKLFSKDGVWGSFSKDGVWGSPIFSILNLNFAAYTRSKNQVWNRPKLEFVKLQVFREGSMPRILGPTKQFEIYQRPFSQKWKQNKMSQAVARCTWQSAPN